MCSPAHTQSQAQREEGFLAQAVGAKPLTSLCQNTKLCRQGDDPKKPHLKIKTGKKVE